MTKIFRPKAPVKAPVPPPPAPIAPGPWDVIWPHLLWGFAGLVVVALVGYGLRAFKKVLPLGRIAEKWKKLIHSGEVSVAFMRSHPNLSRFSLVDEEKRCSAFSAAALRVQLCGLGYVAYLKDVPVPETSLTISSFSDIGLRSHAPPTLLLESIAAIRRATNFFVASYDEMDDKVTGVVNRQITVHLDWLVATGWRTVRSLYYFQFSGKETAMATGLSALAGGIALGVKEAALLVPRLPFLVEQIQKSVLPQLRALNAGHVAMALASLWILRMCLAKFTTGKSQSFDKQKPKPRITKLELDPEDILDAIRNWGGSYTHITVFSALPLPATFSVATGSRTDAVDVKAQLAGPVKILGKVFGSPEDVPLDPNTLLELAVDHGLELIGGPVLRTNVHSLVPLPAKRGELTVFSDGMFTYWLDSDYPAWQADDAPELFVAAALKDYDIKVTPVLDHNLQHAVDYVVRLWPREENRPAIAFHGIQQHCIQELLALSGLFITLDLPRETVFECFLHKRDLNEPHCEYTEASRKIVDEIHSGASQSPDESLQSQTELSESESIEDSATNSTESVEYEIISPPRSDDSLVGQARLIDLLGPPLIMEVEARRGAIWHPARVEMFPPNTVRVSFLSPDPNTGKKRKPVRFNPGSTVLWKAKPVPWKKSANGEQQIRMTDFVLRKCCHMRFPSRSACVQATVALQQYLAMLSKSSVSGSPEPRQS